MQDFLSKTMEPKASQIVIQKQQSLKKDYVRQPKKKFGNFSLCSKTDKKKSHKKSKRFNETYSVHRV